MLLKISKAKVRIRSREAREVVGEILRETRRISGRARNGIKSLVSGASCTSRRSNSMSTTAIKLVAYFSTDHDDPQRLPIVTEKSNSPNDEWRLRSRNGSEQQIERNLECSGLTIYEFDVTVREAFCIWQCILEDDHLPIIEQRDVDTTRSLQRNSANNKMISVISRIGNRARPTASNFASRTAVAHRRLDVATVYRNNVCAERIGNSFREYRISELRGALVEYRYVAELGRKRRKDVIEVGTVLPSKYDILVRMV
ncbi:hypothetical protein P3W45_001866, partial [Vairimorpha bombi]